MSVPLAALRRAARGGQPRPPGERCDMCAEPIAADHDHVVDLRGRTLMCTCRPCHLLFTDSDATLHYRAVPDRYRTYDGAPSLDELQIPVGLAFLFRNSVQQRVVACYPGPAGATESELPLEAWDRIVARDPRLADVRPDVEALLVHRADDACHLVPIDACYELVGRLRRVWRGFDGGREAHDEVAAFFTRVRERSAP
jgi:hypothetical protein